MRLGRCLRTAGLLILLSWGVLSAHRATANEANLGQRAPDFALVDAQGKEHRLAEMSDARLVVVAFLGTECPLARLYAPRLNELAEKYAERGVKLIGINSNRQDSPANIAQYVRELELKFPVAKDPNNMVADGFAAERTPEVFLLDGERKIRYRGRIDDQYVVGLQKKEPSRRDLVEAIEELLSDKPVSVARTAAIGCHIGRVTKPVESEVTYSRQIARIFQKRCVECHREGEIGPFALTSYEDAVGWGETIREVVDAGRMPPWFADPEHGHFINNARLSAEEKQQIAAWVDAGCPEGDKSELPPPRTFTQGWTIPEPDIVLKMSDEPFRVPAEGVIPYKHYVIDPGFTEDKWVVATEARPGNRSVVHHILVFLQLPGQPPDLLTGSLIGAYAPGAPSRQMSPGLAKKIPARAKIVMQIHYTTNGKEQDDISSLGLKFCDAKDVVQEAESGWAVNFVFTIPPGANNHKVTSIYRFPKDKYLLTMTPHMHVRGKSFRYEAVYPDGKREVLLNVPKWDFNWQLDYELAEPKLMPKGTTLRCEAYFDNSADNPANPDPTKAVRFGEQTWDEMMIGWFTTATLPRTEQAQTSRAENAGGQ